MSVHLGPLSPVEVMPAAPKGYTWVLEFESFSGINRVNLWTYKNHPFTWLTSNPSGYSGKLAFVRKLGGKPWDNADFVTDSIDDIVEGTIVAAHEILNELEEKPKAQKITQEKADAIGARLGNVKVRVRVR